MNPKPTNPRAAVLLAAALCGLISLGVSTTAQASYVGTPHTGDRPMVLDIHAGFVYYDIGLASGARFGIPIVPNGFIKSINNAVYINFGADFYWVRHRGGHHGGLGLPVTLHWDFYFSDKWSLYGEAGINIYFHPDVFDGHGWHWSPGHWVTASAGGRFHINDRVGLQLHAGTPYTSFGLFMKF